MRDAHHGELFMPIRTAPRSMKTSVPPWTRGDFRGVVTVGTTTWCPRRCPVIYPRRSATLPLRWPLTRLPSSREGIFQRSITLA